MQGHCETALGLAPDERLARHLIERGKLREPDVARVARMQEAQGSGERLSRLIARLGLLSERDAAQALSEVLGLPLAASVDYPEAVILADQVSLRFLKESQIVPIAEAADGKALLAMADPQDDFAV